MVDAPDVAADVEQTVATLAVGVVGQQVEDGHALQVAAVRLAQSVVLTSSARVGLDIQLQAANTVRALVTNNRGWNHVPAQGLGEQVGGYLALVERATGEVTQGHFASSGLVHAVAR